MSTSFRVELESLINKHSMENNSNTPDFVLAEYLADCLVAFDKATNTRSKWYGQDPSPGGMNANEGKIPV